LPLLAALAVMVAFQPALAAPPDLAPACLACHPWAVEERGFLERAVPGQPEQSPLYRRMADGTMPPGGATPEQVEAVRAWIAAIEPTAPDAVSAATPQPLPAAPDHRVRAHRIAGYGSGALLLGAGAVGAAQWGSLVAEGHAYRDRHGIEEDEISSECAAYIGDLWADPRHQVLRWTHIGLLGAGEVLYLHNAVSGIGMRTGRQPGVTRGEVHRALFVTHASLMVAEAALGFATTSALERGSHWELAAVGAGHAVLGFTIPALVIGSGIAIDRR
jgi:hypothetical protein